MLHEKVRWKQPELSANNSWILHHGNAPAHTALSVREFLATKQITVLEHPAYSPVLAPSDFFSFPKIKEILKGRHFDDIDYIRRNTAAVLKAIPQNQFQNCFERWSRRWHQCIASQGEYFAKATTVAFSNEVCSTFTTMSLRTLLSDHVWLYFLPHFIWIVSITYLYHWSVVETNFEIAFMYCWHYIITVCT